MTNVSEKKVLDFVLLAFFPSVISSFVLKIRGGDGPPPDPSPGSVTGYGNPGGSD